MAPGYKFCGPTQYSDNFNKISKEVHLLVKYKDTSYGLSHKRFYRQTTTAKIKVLLWLYNRASIDFVRESDMAHLVWPGEPGVLGAHLRVAEQLAGLQGVAVVHLVLQPDQGESVAQFLHIGLNIIQSVFTL